MICGHDRETLQWALKYSIALDNGRTLATTRDRLFNKQLRRDAVDSTNDPAKLAAIIKELLRLFDVGAGCWVAGIDIVVWEPRLLRGHGRLLTKQSIRRTMPLARAFALRLLDAPTATAQDIERMIGEL